MLPDNHNAHFIPYFYESNFIDGCEHFTGGNMIYNPGDIGNNILKTFTGSYRIGILIRDKSNKGRRIPYDD